jgi:predicted nucleic acid-binding protein
VERIRIGGVELLACPALIRELADVLERPKFRRWTSPSEAARYCRDIVELATMAGDPVEIPAVSLDSADDYLVALAVSGLADGLVSRDLDLLEMIDSPVVVLGPTAAVRLLDDIGRS